MNTVRMYLNEEKVQKHEDFKERDRTLKSGEMHTDYALSGLPVYRDGAGRFFISSLSLEEPASPILEGLVEELSFYASIPAHPERTLGVYELGSATGTLDGTRNQGGVYSLQIRADELGDIQELYRQIRAGTINPSESWGEEQRAPTRGSCIRRFFSRS